MFNYINNIIISGISSAVSNNWVSIMDIDNKSNDYLKTFVKKIGVKGRYIAGENQTASDFCYAAAENLIKKCCVDKSKIGVVLFVSQSPDYIIPATCCVLHKRLELSPECLCFDVNLGCSGFIYGINIAGSLLSTCDAQYALVLCGDISSRTASNPHNDELPLATKILFGDSGSAILLEKNDSGQLLISSNSDGNGYGAIIQPYMGWRHPIIPKDRTIGSYMDDITIFNFSTNEVVDQIMEYMEISKTSPSDYDYLVLHQANLMTLKRIAQKTGFQTEKNLVSINKFGNTSSASIPNTLVNAFGDIEDNREINALCSGFGIGLSWGTMAAKINVNNILPLIHTDDYYEDGY